MTKDSTSIGSKRPVITDEELAGVTEAFEAIRGVYQNRNTPDTTDIPVPFSDCCAVAAALEELRNIREQSNVTDEQPCPIGINRADVCSAGTCGQCRELRAAMRLCERYGLNAGWCASEKLSPEPDDVGFAAPAAPPGLMSTEALQSFMRRYANGLETEGRRTTAAMLKEVAHRLIPPASLKADAEMNEWLWRWINRMATGQHTVAECLGVMTYHPNAPVWVNRVSSTPYRKEGQEVKQKEALSPSLAAIRMALSTYASASDELRVLQEVAETVRFALDKEQNRLPRKQRVEQWGSIIATELLNSNGISGQGLTDEQLIKLVEELIDIIVKHADSPLLEIT